MADIDRDPEEMAVRGHTEPIANYQGGEPLAKDLVITVGPWAEAWRVIRVDANEGVFHLRKV